MASIMVQVVKSRGCCNGIVAQPFLVDKSSNQSLGYTLFTLASPLDMPSKSTKRPWGMGPAVLGRGNKKRRKAERPVEFQEASEAWLY